MPSRTRVPTLLLAALVALTGGVAPARAADALVPTIAQSAVSYDAWTNHMKVRVTMRPGPGATAPWTWTLVRGSATVGTASATGTAVALTVDSTCSTLPNLTLTVTDAAGLTGTATAPLLRSLCPPAPVIPHARDLVIAPATITEASFIARLRAVGSPALPEGSAIYRTLVAAGVNPSFALGTFQAESSSGKAGYAVTTKNWGNILWYTWEAPFGAVPYDPPPVGSGYVYASYPTWLASVRAYVDLLGRYQTSGYRTVSQASARWLGTTEGSDRHMQYLRNITAVMSALPDDAVPQMTKLTVPVATKPAVTVTYAAKDNEGVTGYEVRAKADGGDWSAPEAVTTTTHGLVLEPGPWTIAVRAADAAGNLSAWREARTRVDAVAPSVTAKANAWIARTGKGAFTVTPRATDDIAVTRLQWRARNGVSGAWSATATTAPGPRTFAQRPGSWYVGVRAADAAGNWSPWTEAHVLVPVDDRAYAAPAGAVRRSSAGAYRGTLTTTTRRGDLVKGSFNGTSLTLIGVAAPRNGVLRLKVDGRTVTVDAGRYAGKRAAKTYNRVLLATITVPAGRHTFSVVNLATSGRPTIAIDGIAFGY